MKELYGVLGYANAPAEAIHGSLNDLRTTVEYLVPWYGIKPIPTALVAVYDWMLDNEASYEVITITDGVPCPKALREGAIKVEDTVDPSKVIIERLVEAGTSGFALIMWDEEEPVDAMAIAVTCIQEGIPALELTAGLSPIIMDDDEIEIGVDFDGPQIDIKDLPPIDPTDWDQETLDVMPASSVKRLARDAGYDVKTKAEAIKVITGNSSTKQAVGHDVGQIRITLGDGSELTFSTNQKLLKEILDLVVKSQS
jgi:hypothetical protein